jgi:ATP-dependent Clp protease protease subunit
MARRQLRSRKKKQCHRRHHRRAHDSSESSDSDDEEDIRVVQNHIYFWCDVTKKSALDLTLKLNEVYNKMRSLTLVGDPITPVYIHINSYGGDLDAALGVVDTMESLKVDGAKIVTIIEGNAASAATLISVVGNDRRIRPNAYMRIHNFSTGISGKKNELDEEYANLDKLEKIMVRVYKKHSNMNQTELKKQMASEIDMTAEEAISKGLVDSIQI